LDLLQASSAFDGVTASYDFIRLLNTNFDSPWIFYSLGVIYKEMWQLETACSWFDQAIAFPGAPQKLLGKTYLELSDTMVWRNFQLPKAIEYAKLSIEMGERAGPRSLIVLSHAYLKNGQVREAQGHLDKIDESGEPEARFLKGLVLYRNGARSQANQVWKPLLTHQSESLRFHNIKQEILKFYFDGTPYLKAN
jgi:tetratricopeptide (TPR) repeat protein